MSEKIEGVVGKINEAFGSIKRNAQDKSVRDDGVKQEQQGKDQQKEAGKAV